MDNINFSNQGNSNQEFQPYNFSENLNAKLLKFLFELESFSEEWKSVYPISKVYQKKKLMIKDTKYLKPWLDEHNF